MKLILMARYNTATQHSRQSPRQVCRFAETGSLLAVSLVALLTIGSGGSGSGVEATATAGRPDGMMPEVVVFANQMPEIVVRATSARPASLSLLPASLPLD